MKNRLKELREAKGLTLDDIENITGIKRGTFNNYENGKTEPKLDTWGKLAVFFDVPVSYLMGITKDKDDYEIEVKKYFDTKWDYFDLGQFQHKFQNPDDFGDGRAPKVDLTDDEKSSVSRMVNNFSNMVVGQTIPYLIDEPGNKELTKIQKKNLKELKYLINWLYTIVQLPFENAKDGNVNVKDTILAQKYLFAILKGINHMLKTESKESKEDLEILNSILEENDKSNK